MRRCEYVKMFDSPPLLGEPFAQRLSGKNLGKYRSRNQFGILITPGTENGPNL
jgi:hypothetical protein